MSFKKIKGGGGRRKGWGGQRKFNFIVKRKINIRDFLLPTLSNFFAHPYFFLNDENIPQKLWSSYLLAPFQ